MAETHRLKTEMETYERHKQELLSDHRGKFALIRGPEIAGIWDTYEDALEAGYGQFGLEPFMVKQIQESEPLRFFGWDIVTCRS
jgi:hypothetical protein